MKINSLLSVIFLTHLFSCTSLYSQFVDGQSQLRSPGIQIDARENFTNDGTVKSGNYININTLLFCGSGAITGKLTHIKCGSYNYEGPVNGNKVCMIQAKTVESKNGYINGNKIILACEEFKFKGTISCIQECLVYAKNTFDQNMFKQSGPGKFTIIMGENNFEKFNQELLRLKAKNKK